MRPIDADNLLKGIEELKESPWFKRGKLEDTDTDVVFNRGLQHCGYLERKEAVEIIENMCIKKEPTIEVEPVKHWHWIVSDTQKHVEVTYECSECQHVAVGEYEKTPFCGGCGARMDGDK